MANDFLCSKCGFNETAHDYPEYYDNDKRICSYFRLSKKDKIENDKIESEKEAKELERGEKINQQVRFLFFHDGVRNGFVGYTEIG